MSEEPAQQELGLFTEALFRMMWAIDDDVEAVVKRYGFDPVEAALGRIKIQMAGPVPQIGERLDDQRTSKGARSGDVRRFGQGSYSGRLLRVFARNAHDGLTDAEATNVVLGPYVSVSKWEGCRRRCSDLREAAYLADTGEERDGRIVWRITSQGRDAYERMTETGWTR